MRQHDFEEELPPRARRRRNKINPVRTGRLTQEERRRLARRRDDAYAEPEIPGGADRHTTWDSAERGPRPRPAWVITELAAVDTELGVLKSGKEADVHLLRRGLPDRSRECLLAAKRYRSSEHRQFQRDSGYLEGRRMRRSRENRAMAQRTSFGRNLIAEQWAVAEFAALSRLWTIGVPVPYPVQRDGTELLLEFVGDPDGTAAPRLAQLRPEPDDLADLWRQTIGALDAMASEGLAHGDLSAYNVLVHDGRIVLIDLPQVVDVLTNPRGPEYLTRDIHNIAAWFTARGLQVNAGDLVSDLRYRAGLA